MTRVANAVLIVILVVVAGCSNKGIDIPLAGVWKIDGLHVSSSYFVIGFDEVTSTGTIASVVGNSRTLPSIHNFEVVGRSRIHIADAQNTEQISDGASISQREEMLHGLISELAFSIDPSSSSEEEQDRVRLLCDGILRSEPITLIQVGKHEWVPSPYRVSMDINVDGAVGGFTQDSGRWETLKTQIYYPSGQVRSLSIQGKEVEIVSEEINMGKIATKRFQNFKLQLKDWDDVRVHITGKHLRQICYWLHE